MSGPDITATVVFHEEGAYVTPALASLYDMVGVARAAGITVEANAILDKPNDLTRHLVSARGTWLDAIHEVSYGDLGVTRNRAAKLASGKYLAFLDGDDLWGEEWLRFAFAAATSSLVPEESIWHPERLFYFFESDFASHSTSRTAHPAARSFHMLHVPSVSPSFDNSFLLLNNVWTANVFARRELHLNHPYQAVDRRTGFGVEDWAWNINTLCKGIPHLVVHDTVHIIRQKEAGSLGLRNYSEGLLTHLPDNLDALFCETAEHTQSSVGHKKVL
jgi:hypothetical protein